MSETDRKYKFSWENTIGVDLSQSRPSLGGNTRIEVYRLFQFTLRDILEQNYGTEMTDKLFKNAGIMAGKEFYKRFLADSKNVGDLVSKIQASFNFLGIGILRVEMADVDKLHFMFTVDEDLDCSGLPDTSDVICVYDEGFIQGILESFSGKDFNVSEVDCWCTGSRTCRFEANGCN